MLKQKLFWLTRLLPDRQYLKLKYRMSFGKKLDLGNPKTFSEKIQWLKLNDRKDIYTKLVDKYEVKKIVSDIIGEEYIIPTLKVYERFDEIDFDDLPEQFVLKCTHDSGGLVIVKDKSKLDIEQARKKISWSLKRKYYYYGREWAYKNVEPRIIAEKYMEDVEDGELRDYKLFCFNGRFEIMFIATNRQGDGDTYFDFFDRNFRHLPFTNGHPNAPKTPHKPRNFGKMVELAEKLSKGIPQVRVDFYDVDGKVYFGEMTFAHWSGMMPFEPEEWDKKLGDLIDLGLVKGGAMMGNEKNNRLALLNGGLFGGGAESMACSQTSKKTSSKNVLKMRDGNSTEVIAGKWKKRIDDTLGCSVSKQIMGRRRCYY